MVKNAGATLKNRQNKRRERPKTAPIYLLFCLCSR